MVSNECDDGVREVSVDGMQEVTNEGVSVGGGRVVALAYVPVCVAMLYIHASLE